MTWISVHKQLPEQGRAVLITWQPKYRPGQWDRPRVEVGVLARVGDICNDERQQLCFYRQYYGSAYGYPTDRCYSGPTHWMPLPQPVPPVNDCEPPPPPRNKAWEAAWRHVYPDNMARALGDGE